MFTLVIHLSHVHFINSFPACSLCLCSLKWSGLLPFARLVEATRAEMVEGERRGSIAKRLQMVNSLLSCLVDRWRPETHTFNFRWGGESVKYGFGFGKELLNVGKMSIKTKFLEEYADIIYAPEVCFTVRRRQGC